MFPRDHADGSIGSLPVEYLPVERGEVSPMCATDRETAPCGRGGGLISVWMCSALSTPPQASAPLIDPRRAIRSAEIAQGHQIAAEVLNSPARRADGVVLN